MANGRPSMDGEESPTVPIHPALNGAAQAPPPGGVSDEVYNRVLQSDIGINTLLARLKQSIASARDFAGFLHKRAQIEEVHAQSLKKLCRTTFETSRRSDARQGTYLQNYEALTRAHEKMGDNGLNFALQLAHMNEELQELARDKEQGRKQWKTTGLAAEKRSQDAEQAMEKAKAKYHSLAQDYHGVKTGDRTGGKFGIKGPKSAAQVEEDTLRKMQAADADYAQKVQTAQAYRKELVETLRPQAIKALEQLVNECDSALTLEVQKFATFNEKLLLSNGLCVSPLDESQGGTRSMREIAHSIDNTIDLKGFVSSFVGRVGAAPEPVYVRHPTQAAGQGPPQAPKPLQSSSTFGVTQPPQQPAPNRNSGQFSTPVESKFNPGAAATASPRSGQFPPPSSGPPPAGTYSAPTIQPVNPDTPTKEAPPQRIGGPPPAHQMTPTQTNAPASKPDQFPPAQQRAGPTAPIGIPAGRGGPPPGGPMPGGPMSGSPMSGGPISSGPVSAGPMSGGPMPGGPNTGGPPGPGGPGVPMPGGMRRPSPYQQFGIPLQDLMERDGFPVPTVVQQCLQAVDLFGLDVEGIYRVSGNGNHIQTLKDAFDTGKHQIDFRNPEAFYHDVNSVAGLLKQFFRDLPDPLMTRQNYQSFIEAARIDDSVTRRDQVHAAINDLPDPNYATLRALTLHLHRVQEHSGTNRMNAGNLAICFGPTLMVAHNMQNIADAGWQVRVVETILQNTLQIFDDD